MTPPEFEVQPLTLPAGYGHSGPTLMWEEVYQRLAEAEHYWLATSRPDHRPHAVPVDGIWLGAEFYFGGSEQSRHVRNLTADSSAVVHTETADQPIIAEGRCHFITPTRAQAATLSKESGGKYHYAPPIAAYEPGVWRFTVAKVMAWNASLAAPTRFVPRAELTA